jgi:hypothetical protein
MSAVEDYIFELQDEQQQQIAAYLHDFFILNYQMTSNLKYAIPFYFKKTWVCYLNPIKKKGIELVFIRARELKDSKHLLDFKKRKMAAGLSFYSLVEIDEAVLNTVLEDALKLDDTTPYTFKKKK